MPCKAFCAWQNLLAFYLAERLACGVLAKFATKTKRKALNLSYCLICCHTERSEVSINSRCVINSMDISPAAQYDKEFLLRLATRLVSIAQNDNIFNNKTKIPPQNLHFVRKNLAF